MKKFRIVFSGIFLFFLMICTRAIFSKSDNKISIQDKMFNEQLSIRVAYSALAPISIFPNVMENTLHSEMDKLLQENSKKQNLVELRPAEDFYRLKKTENSFLLREPVDQKLGVIEKQGEIKTVSYSAKKTKNLQMSMKPAVLIRHEDLQGTINTLPYERIKGAGVRFRYTTIPEEMIGHFWRFKSVDLRGKTIRVYYSGIVPNEITFFLSRSYSSVKASYRIRLKNSSQMQVISFTIPKAFAFKDISIFEFQVEKFHAGKSYGDFLIEKVEVGSKVNGPAVDKIENRSHPFVFGGPYIKSNIWGGEALAS